MTKTEIFMPRGFQVDVLVVVYVAFTTKIKKKKTTNFPLFLFTKQHTTYFFSPLFSMAGKASPFPSFSAMVIFFASLGTVRHVPLQLYQVLQKEAVADCRRKYLHISFMKKPRKRKQALALQREKRKLFELKRNGGEEEK